MASGFYVFFFFSSNFYLFCMILCKNYMVLVLLVVIGLLTGMLFYLKLIFVCNFVLLPCTGTS